MSLAIKFVSTTFLSVLIIGCEEAPVRSIDMVDASNASIIFPALWALSISDSYERFHVAGQNIECFDVQIRSDLNYRYVDYLPLPETTVSPEGRIGTTRNVSSCGRAVTYEYEITGEFIRQYFGR